MVGLFSYLKGDIVLTAYDLEVGSIYIKVVDSE